MAVVQDVVYKAMAYFAVKSIRPVGYLMFDV
jgi:hypothetical protein